MEIFNIIAGVCSILGLVVSLFVASKVIKINETINIKGDNNKALNQSNKSGDNNVYIIMELDIDVEWLRNIIYNDKEKIKKLLAIFNKKNKNSNDTDIMKDIEDKNKKNDLETFYDKFIKKYENEMDILFNFFSDEEMIEEIEIASENIRIAIYSISKSEKLTPKIFNEILQKHTKILNDNEDKKLMRLMIFFLYRHCFIGKV